MYCLLVHGNFSNITVLPRLTMSRLTVPRLSGRDRVLNFILIEVLSFIYEHKTWLFAIQVTSCCYKYKYCYRLHVQPDLLLVCYVMSS